MTRATRLNATTIARPCACRGWIIAPENTTHQMALAVQKHQNEEPHRSWNHRAWQRNNTVKADVPTTRLTRVV